MHHGWVGSTEFQLGGSRMESKKLQDEGRRLMLISHLRTGTLDNPIMVNSFGDEQYAGCTGYPADSHWVVWLVVCLHLLGFSLLSPTTYNPCQTPPAN